MPIYVPESGGITLTELIRRVRRRIGDFPQKRRQVESGDAVTASFHLRDTAYEGTTVTTTVDGDPSTSFTMDYDSNWLTFTAAPQTDDENVVLVYETVTWTDERIAEALNAAIDEQFGRFYAVGENDSLLADGTGELLAETADGYDLGPEDRITRVDWHNGYRWIRLDCWRVRSTPDKKYVVFEQNVSGPIRIAYKVRPGNLSSELQTLEGTAGLPTRAAEPLILLACAALMDDRLHHRIRDDRGHNTQSENPVKSYEIQNDSQFIRAKAEVLISRLKMEPISSRVVF